MSLKEGTQIIKDFIKTLPESAGVYRMLDEGGTPLYIGKAKNLSKRVINYTRPEVLPTRLQRMISLTKSMECIVTKTEAEALILEANLIKDLQPKFNVLLKDDKSFPYILLTADKEFNMMLKFRGKKERKGYYFGPFFSTQMVYTTLDVLQKAFPLRTCTDSTLNNRTRPCLEYHIKRCTAPCVGKISAEDYKIIEKQAKAFLSGKNSDLQQELAQKMQAASENMQYEKAAQIRDRINALTRIQNENKLTISGVLDTDIIAIYAEGSIVCAEVFFIRNGQNMGNRAYFPQYADGISVDEVMETFLMLFYRDNIPPPLLLTNIKLESANAVEDALGTIHNVRIKIETPSRGDKKNAVEMAFINAREAIRRKLAEDATQNKLFGLFAEKFEMAEVPEKIEVYDNSHNQGSAALGAMIVVTKNGFDKKQYRKFNIKTAQTNDDFAMMREVLSRRLERGKKENNLPDVILIDGGIGQLNAVAAVMEEQGVNNVKLIAISKGIDRNAGNEEYHQIGKPSFRLVHGSELAHFMQRIRDEAHRFVIGGHRAKKSKEIKKSQLDEVAGIGASRKKALLAHFGSVADIKNASVEDLMQVSGISRSMAEVIYNHFH